MVSIRQRPARLSLALLTALAWSASNPLPLLAQEGTAPAAEAPPEAAPEAAPKPKPRPRPKPAARPKPAEPEAAAEAGGTPEAKTSTLLEPAAGDTPSQWPNGARAVSESYGDWTMNCTREGAARPECVIIQSQGDRRTGRRQFSIELRVPKDGRAEGLILMPFGMQIEPGVSFKLDERALGKGAPYSYCVNDGCLVPISLPTLATDTMKTAQSLVVSGMKPEAKEPTLISVPLSGFAAAFSRAIALGS